MARARDSEGGSSRGAHQPRAATRRAARRADVFAEMGPRAFHGACARGSRQRAMTKSTLGSRVDLGFGINAYVSLGMAGFFCLLPLTAGLAPVVGLFGG